MRPDRRLKRSAIEPKGLARHRAPPDTSKLAAFPSETAAISYLINAYNAWMLRAVLDAYPIASVMDIGDDPGVFDAKGRICAPVDVVDEIADDFEVKWPEYGWGLNDQAAPWASERDG